MSNFTMADIKRMRESHDARVAAAKAVLTGNFREILNTSTLPKGVKLWWPQNDKPEEAIMRIVDFQTTKAVNAGGTKPGEFSAFRRYKTHNLPDGRTVVCPTTYGKKCPLCETVAAHWDEIKNDKTVSVQQAQTQKDASVQYRLQNPYGKWQCEGCSSCCQMHRVLLHSHFRQGSESGRTVQAERS